jgi:hypothetical protein
VITDRLPTPLRLPLAALALAGAAGCSSLAANGSAPSESDFATIAPGMTRAQVLDRFGPPTWAFRVWQEDLTIWNYRYSHSACVIHQVSLRPDGTVRDAGSASDPACDGGNARD